LGFGVGGLGFWVWGWGPTPQAPIPNPQSPRKNSKINLIKIYYFKIYRDFYNKKNNNKYLNEKWSIEL